MGEVVYLNRQLPMPECVDTTNLAPDENMYEINGVAVAKPNSAYDYQMLCKMFLTSKDYEDILLGILDQEYYNRLEPQLKNVVDCYYRFVP